MEFKHFSYGIFVGLLLGFFSTYLIITSDFSSSSYRLEYAEYYMHNFNEYMPPFITQEIETMTIKEFIDYYDRYSFVSQSIAIRLINKVCAQKEDLPLNMTYENEWRDFYEK